jgi:hypothetical protein
MATYLQRGQAIGDALINGTATASQLNRLGKALSYREARLSEYEAGTNAQKAEIYVTAFRQFCLQVLREYEGHEAVDAARAAAEGAVETDFPEAP